MNSIIVFTDMATASVPESSEKQSLRYVKNSATLLQAFLSHIIDLSAIDGGQLNFAQAPFSIREVVESIGDVFTHEWHARQIELYIWVHDNVPQTVSGDSERLYRELLSLIQHAFKIAETGHILLEVKLQNITEERIDLQFSLFHSGKPFNLKSFYMDLEKYVCELPRESVDLTPIELGLYTTGMLLQHQGAQIWLGQKGRHYQSFNFIQSFAIASNNHGTARPIPENTPVAHVAIISSNRLLRWILKHMLNSIHCSSVGSSTNSDVIHIDEKADLVLCDNSFLEELAEPFADRPVIALCNHSNQPCIDSAIFWPFTTQQLKSSILQALNLPSAENYIQNLSNLDKNVRLLLVEDVLINQQVIKSLLAKSALTVDITNDGLEALEQLKNVHYDLIIMDVQMPNLDGYATTRKIRQELNLRNIPIIALTAFTEQGDRERCLLSGMNDYLSKPIDPDHFYKVLWKWLKD